MFDTVTLLVPSVVTSAPEPAYSTFPFAPASAVTVYLSSDNLILAGSILIVISPDGKPFSSGVSLVLS